MLELLEAAGGVLQVEDPPADVRAAWRRLLHVVRRDGHVPKGWHLRQRGRDVGDLVIELRPGEHPAHRYRPSAAGSVPVHEELIDAHPVVDALRNQPDRLPASPSNRSRALMLLQALAVEAGRRGMTIKSGTKSTLMTVVAANIPYGVQVFEESGARWTLRLSVAVTGPGTGSGTWTDHVKRPVEIELAAVLDEIGQRAVAIAAHQQARERREAELRDREFQQATTRHRSRILLAEVTAWRLANDIRGHCDQLVAAGLAPDDPWVRWARRYADDTDPTIDPHGLPDPPTDEDLMRERWAARQTTPAPSEPLQAARPAWHPNRRWWHG